MKNLTEKYFYKNISIAPLITFRVVFGAMMLFSTTRFVALGWVKDHFIDAQVNFKYYGFAWVQVAPPNMMYAIHGIMILAALGILLGAFYRISAILFFLTFVYTELIDITYYLNHYYFVSIIAFLLIFVPANRQFSIDAWRNPAIRASHVSALTINIFKLQLAIVYIFAGLIKINYDWLINALPLKIWIPANDTLPLIGWLMQYEATPYIFSWAGMLYDTTIVFWLLLPKTRPFAYFTVIVFHAITGMMFQIGVFPLVMIGATLIFFSEKWHEKLYEIFGMVTPPPTPPRTGEGSFSPEASVAPFWGGLGGVLGGIFFILFFIFQLLFPWRFLLYDGNMFWTEQGYRFGWRVMLMEKAGTATFYVKDAKTGREGAVLNTDFLCSHQEKQMAMQPDLILQYAHFLKKHYASLGVETPSVRAEIYVTLNGKPSKLLIDPNLDLTKIEDSWANKSWILPFEK